MVSERNLKIFQQYNEGRLPSEICKENNFSKQRLFQIISKVSEETGEKRRSSLRGKGKRPSLEKYWEKMYKLYMKGESYFSLYMESRRRRSPEAIAKGLRRWRRKHRLPKRGDENGSECSSEGRE